MISRRLRRLNRRSRKLGTRGLAEALTSDFRQRSYDSSLIKKNILDSSAQMADNPFAQGSINEPTAEVSGIMSDSQVMGGIAGAATGLNNPFAEGADVDAFTNVPPPPSSPSSFNDESQGIANGVFGNIFDRQDSVQAPLMFKIKK